MRKRLLSLALAATVLAAQPAAADYAAGWAALQAGDFATALAEWQPLAERGHVKAQAGLGFMYLNGLGVAEDTEAAFVWFVEAANGGDADAMFVIANLYFFGEGGRPQNFSAAAEWYAVAEETLPGGRGPCESDPHSGRRVSRRRVFSRTTKTSVRDFCDISYPLAGPDRSHQAQRRKGVSGVSPGSFGTSSIHPTP